MLELLEELKHNREINLQQGLENRVDIDYIIERIESINVYFEVAKCEVETAIEDIYNDELYSSYQNELKELSKEDINRIAWKVYDYDIWSDAYDSARNEVYEEIGVED